MSRQISARRPWSPSTNRPAASLRYCLSGGGTGGHVYPALAVAAVLSQAVVPLLEASEPARANGQRPPPAAEQAKVEVIYIGSTQGMERRIVEQESTLPYRGIPAAALRGRNPLVQARNALTMTGGTLAAYLLLRDLRPAAILGTGGYVCVPLFFAARLLRIPTLLYLPDIVPGLAVRLLAQIATRVACSVEETLPRLKQQVRLPWARSTRLPPLVSGYPVRPELFTQEQETCRASFGLRGDMPVTLIYGGSRGARNINRAVEALLPRLLDLTQVIHICGREGDETWLRAAAERLPPAHQARYHLFPYLEQHTHADEQQSSSTPRPTMAQAFGASDLAVCRSGASIIGELPALGLPALLIPYPYVNQEDNADYLVRRGAAIQIADAAMMPDDKPPHEGALYTWLDRLLRTHTNERLQMAQRSRELARPDAAHALAHALYSLTAA